MINQKTLSEKQRKRYQRILEQSYDIVVNNGFYKLSLSDLTNQLRVSRSTIYENFGSKEGLIEKIAERYNEQLNHGLLEIMKEKKLSTFERFLAISDQLVVNSPSRNVYKFYNDLKIHLPELYEQYLVGRRDRIEQIYRPLIQEGIKAKLFDKSIPEDFLMQSYLKSSQMVCETDMLENSSLSKTEAMNLTVKIFLNGAKQL